MKKLLSVLYQYYLKGKKTKDIPYVSALNAIFFTIIVNIAALSFGFEVNLLKLIPLNWGFDNKLVQYVIGIMLMALIYYVIILFMPKEKLQKTNFSSKEYKIILRSFFTYLILSVLSIVALMIKYFITHR